MLEIISWPAFICGRIDGDVGLPETLQNYLQNLLFFFKLSLKLQVFALSV